MCRPFQGHFCWALLASLSYMGVCTCEECGFFKQSSLGYGIEIRTFGFRIRVSFNGKMASGNKNLF